ncbi:MAG: endonuclease/exonuclease/phosphatase family protein [Candidatus Sumerlaeia bacterium]|nr:endonuclease/exonuclease/phosphatase family protein [Candidatus Sumerlaeia bacterium]
MTWKSARRWQNSQLTRRMVIAGSRLSEIPGGIVQPPLPAINGELHRRNACLILLLVLLVAVVTSGCLAPRDRSHRFPSPTEETATFTVATWNIAEKPFSPKHLEAIGQDNGIDILLLQEIMIRAEEPLQAVEKAHPPFDAKVVVPVNPAGDGMYESQAILVRGRIDEHHILPLDHVGEKQRVALLAKVDLHSGERLVVINTDHEISFFGLGPNDRQHQVNSLVGHLATLDHSLPIIVGGDFNSGGAWTRPFWGMTYTREIDDIDKTLGAVDFKPLFQPSHRPLTFFQPPWPVWRTLDLFYFRDLEPVAWETRWHPHLSDHAMVVATFGE